LMMVLSVAGVAGLQLALFWIQKYAIARRRESYKADLRVTGIFTYPIKSCKGNSHQQLSITSTGLQNDRLFVLIEAETNHFITARTHPKLVLLEAVVEENGSSLRLSHPDVDDNKSVVISIVNQSHPNATERQVTVWSDVVPSIDQGDAAAEFCSKALKTPGLRLVRIKNETARPSDRQYAPEGDHVSLADGFSYLFATEESLAGVNDLISDDIDDDESDAAKNQQGRIDMRRFRPNLVVSSGSGRRLPSFEEENWKKIRVGDIIFEHIKLCSRCKLTTVVPDNGTFASDAQPLKVLKKKRALNKQGNSTDAYFGINMIAANGVSTGTVAVGDRVEVLEYYSLDEIKNLF
jgi:uncharacterized protein